MEGSSDISAAEIARSPSKPETPGFFIPNIIGNPTTQKIIIRSHYHLDYWMGIWYPPQTQRNSTRIPKALKLGQKFVRFSVSE
jgi:hypothetical protein